MKILLKKDRKTIEFVDGITELNANDVMVNTLEVELESPLLHGETLWVTFEKEDQGLEMTKPILATNEYKVTIPASVIKVPGEWSLQLFIKRYDAVSKNLVNRQASNTVTFTVENGLYVDDEMDLANNGSLASLYSIADKNTQELPLTLQHLMDFTNQPFYASDGSLAVEKSGITYDDLMAKLKGDADTLTLADVVTTWKREGFNRDARVGDEFFGTARTKDDYIVGLNCKVIKVDESEERKGRPYWGVTDVEVIRYPDKEIALVSNITLEFSKTYAEIVELTNAGADVDSFPVDGLNRRPNIGERFFAVCTSGDKYGFGMTAEVVSFATDAEGREYAVFKCIEVVLLAGSTIPKQVKELQRRMSKIDGGAGSEEGEEENVSIVPLVLNDFVNFSDLMVAEGRTKSFSLENFNRLPYIDEYFLMTAYDINGKVYCLRGKVISVGTSFATCRIVAIKILHDEERLSSVEAIAQQNTSDIEGIRQDIINESHFRGYLLTNADVQALAGNANDYAYSAESGTKWIFHPAPMRWINSGVPVPDQTTPASDATPLMDGEASAGQEGAYARGDHRHPSDTSKVNKAGDTMTGDLQFERTNGWGSTIGYRKLSFDYGYGMKVASLDADNLQFTEGQSDDIKHVWLDADGLQIARGDASDHIRQGVSVTHEGIIEHTYNVISTRTQRKINLPARRWTDHEQFPGADYYLLDETLAALSDIEPIKTKLDEVEGIAKGGQQGISFVSYADMVSELAGEQTELTHPKNQSIYIETVDVPDLWISKIEDVYETYEYTNDDAIVSALATNGYIQVGYYRLAQLETGKVNLPDYVKFTDWATTAKAGLVQIPNPAQNKGIVRGNTNPILEIAPTTNSLIDERKGLNPIVPARLDYATMSALANCKEPELWTDDNKAKACELLGAVKKYVGTSGNIYIPAIKGGEGTQTQYRLSEYYQQGLGTRTIPLRDSEGGLQVQENPTKPLHAVPKQWVEGLIAELASVEGHVTIVQGTKLYKHTLANIEYTNGSGNDGGFMIISSRSTPYTTITEIKKDFEKPDTCITVQHSWLGTQRCYEVHAYGGFFFKDVTVEDSTGGAFASVTDTVTEYEG